jgi:hypothetical protein
MQTALIACYCLTALVATAALLRTVQWRDHSLSLIVKLLCAVGFGYMAFAATVKGFEAIQTGNIRLVSRLSGVGSTVGSDSLFFWVQLAFCWGVSTLAASFSLASVLLPLKRGA